MPLLFSSSSALISLELSGTHIGHRHPSISRPEKNDHDLGVLGVLIHVIGDAINNVGVIIYALVSSYLPW
jgi:zinc transporter 1